MQYKNTDSWKQQVTNLAIDNEHFVERHCSPNRGSQKGNTAETGTHYQVKKTTIVRGMFCGLMRLPKHVMHWDWGAGLSKGVVKNLGFYVFTKKLKT